MCVSKVQHVTGRKTGCNRSRPVFFGFSIFRQTSQLATEKIQNLCNRNQWSGLFQLGSVRFRSFFQSSELDLRTLASVPSPEDQGRGNPEMVVDKGLIAELIDDRGELLGENISGGEP